MRDRVFRFAVLVIIGSGALFAAAFQNGGFESPVIMGGPDFVTVPTDWTKYDPSCGGTANCAGSGLFMQLYSTFGLPTTGGEGNQAFGFGGNGVQSGSLLQTFETVAGAMYHISFQYVIQQGSGLEDLVADVLDGTAAGVSTDSNGCSGPACLATTGDIKFNNAAWVTATLDFIASSTSTTLRFSDFSGVLESAADHVSTNWALDAVSVTETSGPTGVPTGVPEPSTVALVSLGSLAALALRRRFHRKPRV
jgi:hypothetical protein